jgi:ubiquinone/menaquinone biosynthesis C-methylase UbiE
MSYQHEHIPFFEPVDWYDQTAKIYHTYHSKLNERDRAALKKYLPRSLQGIHVADLWWGDGRWAKTLQWSWIASRTIIDISQQMLENAPSRTKKVCADLRKPLPLESGRYDLLLCTFVLGHLDQIETIFAEARRCIAPTGRMLLVYHHERRPFVHHLTDERPLKIKTWNRRDEDIEVELIDNWWEVDVFVVDDVTKIYCCFPIVSTKK